MAAAWPRHHERSAPDRAQLRHLYTLIADHCRRDVALSAFLQQSLGHRTGAGRVAAQARGVRFGRPSKLTADQVALGQRLVAEGTSAREAAKLLKCHYATLYRALAAAAARSLL